MKKAVLRELLKSREAKPVKVIESKKAKEEVIEEVKSDSEDE